MRKRGHPGYWLMAALFGSATLGLLYLAGVDEPLRDPWSALVTVAAAAWVAVGALIAMWASWLVARTWGMA